MRQTICLLFMLVLLMACTPAQEPSSEIRTTIPPDTAVPSVPPQSMPATEASQNPFSAQSGDSKLIRQKAFVQEASLVIRESYPPQISLNLSGVLPTPCNRLRADIGQPSPEDKINIVIYSVVDPNLMCTQVVQPFAESINLGTFPSGHYSVLVNGEVVGEFDS